MGCFSDLDIIIKSTPGLSYASEPTSPTALPVIFEYKTPNMKEPKTLRTRVTPGSGSKVLLWPGCWVQYAWLIQRKTWTRVPGWDSKVRFIEDQEVALAPHR